MKIIIFFLGSVWIDDKTPQRPSRTDDQGQSQKKRKTNPIKNPIKKYKLIVTHYNEQMNKSMVSKKVFKMQYNSDKQKNMYMPCQFSLPEKSVLI